MYLVRYDGSKLSDDMLTAEAISRFQTLAEVVGVGWMRRNSQWFESLDMPPPVWFEQSNVDLDLLVRRLGLPVLIRCYRAMLRDRKRFLDGLYEVHSAALLSDASADIALHVPRVPGGPINFDVKATIEGHAVNADCKARRDEFPFNVPRTEEEGGLSGFFGTRATIDPHDARAMGLPPETRLSDATHITTPESTVIRQRLLQALSQLPESGINLVLFGHIRGQRGDLERALYGAPVVDFIRNHDTREVTSEWHLAGTAAFTGDALGAFGALSAVLWFRLMHLRGPLQRAYKLYVNPARA